jgi:phosphoribosylanthranilate isomerase
MKRANPLEVKVCGMRADENIARVAELSPDYLGFIFVPESPRYVGDSLSKELVKSLPSAIATVGVFRNQSSTFVVDAVQSLGLHVVQLHGTEDGTFVRNLKITLPSVEIWKAVGISSRGDVSALDADFDGVDRFVLDSGMGGTGHAFDWQWLFDYRAPAPFVLAGGIGSTNIDAALDVARHVEALVGVDINSRVESEPGIKDVEKVKGILDKVRNRS